MSKLRQFTAISAAALVTASGVLLVWRPQTEPASLEGAVVERLEQKRRQQASEHPLLREAGAILGDLAGSTR